MIHFLSLLELVRMRRSFRLTIVKELQMKISDKNVINKLYFFNTVFTPSVSGLAGWEAGAY